jgi:hypothetical protein
VRHETAQMIETSGEVGRELVSFVKLLAKISGGNIYAL